MKKYFWLIALICLLFVASEACDRNVPVIPQAQEEIVDEVGEGDEGEGEGEGDDEVGEREGEEEGGEGDEGEGKDEEKPFEYQVVDPGKVPTGQRVLPSHPDLVRTVEYTEFYDPYYDFLDDYGNVDYVISQGFGTAWPIITSDYHIRLYQARGTKGGSYIRVRAQYDSYIKSITAGSATGTYIAYSLNGKAAKSSVSELPAGGRFTFNASDGEKVKEICLWCMGTSSSERWELDYLKLTYSGGYVEEDFLEEPCEYGPLVKVTYPFSENFEDASYPVTDKNTYEKYGLQAGPENFQWSTWYGCFSWQHPKEIGDAFGAKSPQLRVYQEDPDYEKSQYGHLQMEYFLKDLSEVEFDYYYSEYWVAATVSYCDFGQAQWHGSQSISLAAYSDRQTVRHFKYILDGGIAHDAKIRISIDESTGHPTSGHYDLIFDNFKFNTTNQ